MRRGPPAIALVILVAASLGIGYLAGNSVHQTETLTSTSTLTALSTITAMETVTSTTTSTIFTGPPIPVASIETWNVTVGDLPDVIALNLKTGMAYLTNTFSHNLTVVYLPSHSVIARIVLPSRPVGITVDDSTNMVYASVSGGIAEINGSTDKVVGELMVGLGGPQTINPSTLAINPSTHIIYSVWTHINSREPAETIAGVDVRTGSVVANVSLGYPVYYVAVNPETNMVYAAGCPGGFVCDSSVSIVNGTSGTLLTTVNLHDMSNSGLTVNSGTNIVYVSGYNLVALNGTNGKVIFSVNPLTCGLSNMIVIPYLNEVAATAGNYVLLYDGATGTLLNMYSIPNGPWRGPGSVAFNPQSNELYTDVASEFLSQFVSFPNVASTGAVDSTLMGSGQNCPPP
jgi:hypothetical protein